MTAEASRDRTDDEYPQCMHTFTFGKSKHPMFSDNALARMREELAAPASDP
jgi:hypothetical protein